MLEFKKKTRAHKWRNYAVYGLLTLSQLSKTGFKLIVYIMDITWAIFDNIIVIFWIIIPCNETVNADYHIRDFTYISMVIIIYYYPINLY